MTVATRAASGHPVGSSPIVTRRTGGMSVLDVQRIDYIRVPVRDMDKANHFYGEVLGLERNPNSPGDDWVEYDAGNITLA